MGVPDKNLQTESLKGKTCKILLAEDHAVTGWGLAFLLSGIPGIELVDQVVDGNLVEPRINDSKPDILILDILLPGKTGLEILSAIQNRNFKVITFSGQSTGEDFQRALDLGSDALVSKADPPDEMIEAIKTLRAGKSYLSTEARRLIGHDGNR